MRITDTIHGWGAQLMCRLHGKQRASLRDSEEGSVLIEIAVALPVLVALFTGIVSFGLTLSTQLTLSQAVGTGGQYLQQIRNSTTDPCKDTLTTIESAAPYLNAANLTLTFTLNGTKITANSCAGDQTDLVEGAPVTVAATYPCSLQIYGVSFANSCQLSAQVTEYEY